MNLYTTLAARRRAFAASPAGRIIVDVALAVFLLVVAVDVLALVLDFGYLKAFGYWTISHHIWVDPDLAWIPLGWNLVGLVALGVHLLVRPF